MIRILLLQAAQQMLPQQMVLDLQLTEQMLLGHITQAMMHGLQISMHNFIQEEDQEVFLLVEMLINLLGFMQTITITLLPHIKIQMKTELITLI